MYDEEIEEYNLGAEFAVDHDTMIMEQAGKLMNLGYLEHEIAAYATAVYRENDVYYYISSKEKSVSEFVQQCYALGQYPTPTQYFFKRYDRVYAAREEINAQFHQEIAFEMQKIYPKILFEAIADLTDSPSNDSGLDIAKNLANQLENSFDFYQIKIYEEMLNMLLAARFISASEYQLLQNWCKHEFEKFSIEPVKTGAYDRTYGGFAYQMRNGKISYFIDAVPHIAYERQREYISKGYIVTPIFVRPYCANSFAELFALNNVYAKELEQYFTNQYMELMKLLRTLPPTVDQNKFYVYWEKVKETGSVKAIEALDYYGYLWNVFSPQDVQ